MADKGLMGSASTCVFVSRERRGVYDQAYSVLVSRIIEGLRDSAVLQGRKNRFSICVLKDLKFPPFSQDTE